MGRPRKHQEIPPKKPGSQAERSELTRIAKRRTEVENYARLGGTDTEIASILKTSPQTLKRACIEELQAGRSERRLTLRRKQTEAALRGNIAMLIYLGKVELGQREFEIQIDPATLSIEQIERLLDGESLPAVLSGPA